MFIPLWLIVIIIIAIVLYYLGVKSSVSTYQDNVRFERERNARFIETITEAAAAIDDKSRIKISYALNSYAIEILWNLKFRPGQESLDRADYFLDTIDTEIETLNECRENFENYTDLKLKSKYLDSQRDYAAEALSRLLARIEEIKVLRYK